MTPAHEKLPPAQLAPGVVFVRLRWGGFVLRRTKRIVYTCSVILKSVRYITLMFKLDNGILGTRKG